MAGAGTQTPSAATGAPVDGVFSCVVDNHPRFHLEALRWFACLTEVAGVDPARLVVSVVGPTGSETLAFLRSAGVTVREVGPFDERSPHCNKISGALRLADDGVEGVAVLCDADIAVLEDPRQVEIPPCAIAAKTVDAPLPPIEVLDEVFRAAGLPAPPTVPLPWGPDQWTRRGNSNGGLYLVPGPLLARVASAWATWAAWLLDRSELMQEWTVHVDQVAMALGLTAEGIGSDLLGVRWNTPTHDPTRIPAEPPRPAVLHYHQEVEADGRLRTVGRPAIDARIEEANTAIARVWRAAVPEVTMGRWLAGPGATTGGAATTGGGGPEAVRPLLRRLVDGLGPDSVLEVGCRPDRATEGLAIPGYLGIDPSPELVARAATTRPDGEFVVGVLPEHPVEADLVVCLDVLGRLADPVEYQSTVQSLWSAARRALVVSGYDDPFGMVDSFSLFHEPLAATLRRVASDAEVYPVASEGSEAVYVALRRPVDPHPRDFTATTLAPLARRVPDPVSLLELRLHARRTTGFYPDHTPRLWEYPVVARLVEDHLPAGSRVVDVGAGVSPLTPFLADRGFVVETVDPSPVQRSWEHQREWNEWSYLDYGAAGLAHRSWNCTLDAVPRRPVFDGAYSVSVIEHVPASVRRELLADISERTRAGGLVVLTIDLMRDEDALWNHNLGVEVEDPADHGTIDDVIEECAGVGLALFHREVIRDWPDTHVDIGLLALRQTRSSPPRWRGAAHQLRTSARRLRTGRS